MKIEVVFTENDKALRHGKPFEVILESIPGLNEYIIFDFLDHDESLSDLDELLKEIKADTFKVLEVYHYCMVNMVSEVKALVFVEPCKKIVGLQQTSY